jgi:hypothetical protein
MAFIQVAEYGLGFRVPDKQCSVYYTLVGDPSAHQILVTAEEMVVLADMFKNEGAVSYNTDGSYFVTGMKPVGWGRI